MNLPTDLARAMEGRVEEAASFLKGLASPHRLLVLCVLAEGEQNVATLIAATGLAQTSMSQHLAKLRDEGIVAVRRDHRTLYYRIAHPAVLEVMAALRRHFCVDEDPASSGGGGR